RGCDSGRRARGGRRANRSSSARATISVAVAAARRKPTVAATMTADSSSAWLRSLIRRAPKREGTKNPRAHPGNPAQATPTPRPPPGGGGGGAVGRLGGRDANGAGGRRGAQTPCGEKGPSRRPRPRQEAAQTRGRKGPP